MSLRTLIYFFTFLAFLPAVPLFIAGTALIPQAVLIDIGKGNFESILLMLPLIGGGLGLGAAYLVTLDIADYSVSSLSANVKRFGLCCGLASESFILYWLTPSAEPFLAFWLPPLIGGTVLLILSYGHTANKAMKDRR